MTDAARAQIASYLSSHLRGRDGQVIYDLQRDFGVSADDVRAEFGFYFDRFPVRQECDDRDDDVDRLIDERPGRNSSPPIRRPGQVSQRPHLPSGAPRPATCCWPVRRAASSSTAAWLRGASPQTRLRRRLSRSDAVHHHHPGARRPRRGCRIFREPTTRYVAQTNNPACQSDDERMRRFRMRTAGVWFDMTGADAIRIAKENRCPVATGQARPDIMFGERLSLR